MTTSPVPTAAPITSAAASDAESAIAVLTLAFSADPANRWVWPDPRQYLASFPAFVSAFAGEAFEHGTAYCIDGYAGVALWLPPGVHSDEDALGAFFQSTVAEEDQDDLMAVLEQMGKYHPSEPHWYLPLIGVDPAHRGQGYGSQLLRHALAACDRDGTPAYLESSNAANIALYERHGFEVLGTIHVGSSPPLFPMLRSAR
jgi:ribosomal protein S18 acetylase RimI-like enzyme